MIMLVVGMMLVTPAMACPAGKPCAAEERLKAAGHSEITGVEKNEAILFASNLEDVKTLSNNRSMEALKQNSDYAKIYSFEENGTNGSADHIMAAILPVELSGKDKEIKNTYVVAVWDSENTARNRVMSYSATIKNGHLHELTFGRVSDNGKILNESLVSNGSVVEDQMEVFASGYDGFWDCVVQKLSGDCWCLFTGGYCPPGIPSICTFCEPVALTCLSTPNQVSCGILAVCMGLEIASVMYQCRSYL